ncbi:unnamed protein product, partial [Amoebophrya sp. A25]
QTPAAGLLTRVGTSLWDAVQDGELGERLSLLGKEDESNGNRIPSRPPRTRSKPTTGAGEDTLVVQTPPSGGPRADNSADAVVRRAGLIRHLLRSSEAILPDGGANAPSSSAPRLLRRDSSLMKVLEQREPSAPALQTHEQVANFMQAELERSGGS